MSTKPASRLRLGGLAAMLTALMGFAIAAPQERAQLRAERHQLSETFAREERACALQFMVTACLDDARARRREALAPLRERELSLDEAERRAKADQRRLAIAAKQALAASQPAASPVRVRSTPATGSVPATAREPRLSEAVDRATAAAARARALEEQHLGAVQAQQRVVRREAARLAVGRKAAPLPTPASSAASGTSR